MLRCLRHMQVATAAGESIEVLAGQNMPSNIPVLPAVARSWLRLGWVERVPDAPASSEQNRSHGEGA